MNFSFYDPVRILFGRGQLNNLHLQNFPGKKALIVISAGKSIRQNGYLDRVEKQLDMAGIEHVIFDKILPNPILSHVTEGAKVARDNHCDFVIGLGGGSSIDSAKAIAVMATNDGNFWDYVGAGSGKGKPVEKKPLPIIAITTTAGTGTEADPWMVITKEDTDEKIGSGWDSTFPYFSIVDPELMLTVPPALTAYQGFDALFHSTEGYINVTANVISDMFAMKSIELIGANLAEAVANGNDIDARENVALANTLSGIVESLSGCTSEHSLEHALSAFHHNLPHGAGLIMISKAYYTFFAKSGACDEKLIAMAKGLGKKDAKEPMDFVEALVDLQKKCGVDALKMSDYGITKSELPEVVKNARHTMGGLFNVDPAVLSDEDCLKIYEESYR